MVFGFLQRFLKDEVLGERSLERVAREGYKKAIELGMLGMTKQADAIFQFLHSANVPLSAMDEYTAATSLFYHSTKLQSPFPTKDVTALQTEVLQNHTYHVEQVGEDFDFDNIDLYHFEDLLHWAMELHVEREDATGSRVYANTTTGYIAMQFSQALMVLFWEADKLGRAGDIDLIATTMLSRIHANQQATYASMLLRMWDEYFLPGKLRKSLDVTEAALDKYAGYVLDTLKERLDKGAVSTYERFKDMSFHEMLEALDANTMSDKEYDPIDYGYDPDGDDPPPTTIFLDPATDEDITDAEERIGRTLPDEIKEFYRITNGCSAVKDGPSFRTVRFVPLDEVNEEDAGLSEYGFYLLPDFELDKDYDDSDGKAFNNNTLEEKWGDAEEEGEPVVGLYENDGQGTIYTWLMPKCVLDRARAHLAERKALLTPEKQAKVDEEIVGRWGSMEAYEGMEYCIYTQGWGEPDGQRLYPTWRHYVSDMLYKSLPNDEESPVNAKLE